MLVQRTGTLRQKGIASDSSRIMWLGTVLKISDENLALDPRRAHTWQPGQSVV
jgi:hypothetical protein